jgi:uncharacterized protein YndB with AHSA1/START domain
MISDTQNAAGSPGGTKADELLFVRVFEAPRQLVFRCMTSPEHLTHFWGPKGTSTPIDGITVEPRPGGRFATVMVSDADGSRYATDGVFLEVVEPERLVWTESRLGLTTTTTFLDLGGDRTEVRIHQTKVPAAMLAPEAQAGFLTSLDKFEAYLASLVASSAAVLRSER